MKIVVTTVAVIIALVGVLFLWGVLKYKAHFKTMSPTKTGEITENLFAVKDDFVNAYFLKTPHGKYIAIDAGLSAESMGKELQKCDINPKDVDAVFLTHTDYDHTGGLPLFPSAKVFLSKREEVMIDGKTARAPFMKNRLQTPYTALKDGEIINTIGFKIQAILTPGHTSGSTCYIVNDSMLFTGDLFKLENEVAQVFIPDFNMDTKESEKSMKTLRKLPPFTMICTGHFGYTKNIKWEK